MRAGITATNSQPAWINVGTNFTFNSTGQLTPPLSSLTLNNVSVDSLSLGSVQVAFGAGGLTQFSNTNGTVQVNLLDQNGAAAGQLQSIAVDSTSIKDTAQKLAMSEGAVRVALHRGLASLTARLREK